VNDDAKRKFICEFDAGGQMQIEVSAKNVQICEMVLLNAPEMKKHTKFAIYEEREPILRKEFSR
jgi:hypothetical protein